MRTAKTWIHAGCCAGDRPGRRGGGTGGSAVDHPHRRADRWNGKYGVDFIKIIATGGVFTARSDPGSASFTRAEIEAAVDEARTVEVGKYADLVAVPRNPLDDIQVLETIPWIMKGGRIVKDETAGPDLFPRSAER